MDNLKLSPRLLSVASMVKDGACLADIGTDHGYLPVSLILKGTVSKAIAADINEGPLLSARQTAEKYGVSDKIEFVLTDGLSGMENMKFDTVSIAGMGGETMVHILENAKFLKERDVCLILQPQSKIAELRRYLSENGYEVTNEKLSKDADRLYIAMSVQYTGNKTSLDFKSLIIGKHLFLNKDPLLPEYIDMLTDRCINMMSGMEKSSGSRNSAQIHALRKAVMEFSNAKEETEKW